MKPDNMTKADLVTGIVLIVFSLTVIEESWRMPRLASLGVKSMSVPGLVPGLLGIVLLLLGIVLTIRSFKRGGHHMSITRENFAATLRQPGNLRLVLALFLCVGYAGVAVGRMPYWLATGLFVFLFTALFEWRRDADRRTRLRALAFALFLAVLTSGFVTWIFQTVFLVTLP